MRRALAAALCCLWIQPAAARAGSGEGAQPATGTRPPVAAPLPLSDAVLDKNFYFVRLIEEPGVRKSLQSVAAFSRLDAAYRARLAQALTNCGADGACYVTAALLTHAETADVEAALRSSCIKRMPACAGIADPLRASGTMIRFQERRDDEFLAEAWKLTTRAVNHVFKTYGDGTAPRYPTIDGMSQDPHSPAFGEMVRTATRVVVSAGPDAGTFLSAWVKFAGLLLTIDGRDEAGRHEPLERGENRAAYEHVKAIDGSRYPYSAILVPGQGPEEPGVRLAPQGRLRLELAVARYRQGAAPLIVVSGGYVHPARTPFNEAIEMKRALIEEFRLPPEAIVIDPHARHTTTNLRNTVRLLYRYGVAIEKPVLVVSDEKQIAYIMTSGFEERNQGETGIVPWLRRRLVSPVEVELVPNIESLQAGFEDPLDP